MYTLLQAQDALNNADINNNILTRDDLVRHYFEAGYSYDELLSILVLRHDITISLRTLHRILRKLNLRRRSPNDLTLNRFLISLEAELQGSGHNLGCRAMAKRMLSRYSLNVPRRIVLEGQRMLDPVGVELRGRHRLRRRSYINKGPNYAIHVDQHDKLKVYGFALHGAIDGFSRRVLWLRVAHTNNDPQVVASYFVDFLQEIEGVPRCVQMDRGTENVLIEDIQEAFHSEYNGNDHCVIKSTSPHNQRIERFWRTLFAMMENYWVDIFRALTSDGILDCTSQLQVECFRFCFNQMIQTELDSVRMEWNQHWTRASPNVVALPGKPDIMYFLPTLYDTHDYRIPVRREDVLAVKNEFTTPPTARGCSSTDMEDVLHGLMTAHDKAMPSTVTEGVELFQWLCDKLENE